MNALPAGDADLFSKICNKIGDEPRFLRDFFALTRGPSAHDIASRIESARPERSPCIPFCHIST